MRRFAAAALLLLLLPGCNDTKKENRLSAPPPAVPGKYQAYTPAGTDEEQVRQVVIRYDQLVAEGYRILNMSRLVEVATQDQAEKAYFHMAAIGEGQVRMLSEMKKIDFTSVKRVQPDTFVVRTRELWDFAYTDIKTGKETGKEKDFVYEMTFTLKKTGPRWVITDSVAYAPNDKEEKAAPRVIKPAHEGTKPEIPLPPGHRKVNQ
ncbi:hypothetical protein [Geomesophilobacter sediminis]|uniref:Lipoprotein n=1 Tax=Geomesophilobacter sediminis TaxID=2798584 RepID=A0A8J7J4E2_9BACT|nr:hypothetical protein [Geomesophilobacter sediminis]MBJ6725713.1 hypothetical protein [Geomesophilobacter sediminis]